MLNNPIDFIVFLKFLNLQISWRAVWLFLVFSAFGRLPPRRQCRLIRTDPLIGNKTNLYFTLVAYHLLFKLLVFSPLCQTSEVY